MIIGKNLSVCVVWLHVEFAISDFLVEWTWYATPEFSHSKMKIHNEKII